MTVARNEIMNSICKTKSGHVSEMWCIMRLFNNARACVRYDVCEYAWSISMKTPSFTKCKWGLYLRVKG